MFVSAAVVRDGVGVPNLWAPVLVGSGAVVGLAANMGAAVKEAHMCIPSDRVEYFDTRADLPEVGCTIITYYAVDEDEFYYYTPSAGWH